MSQLAEFNIAALHQPLDAEENAEFVAALEPINTLTEATPGFIWRLQNEEGASVTYLRRRSEWFEKPTGPTTVCW